MTIDVAPSQDYLTAVRPGLLQRLCRFPFSNTALAFADQCAVSGQAFLILLMMGAFADLAQVGAFAVAFSVIVIALAVQDAATTRPYTVQLHMPIGSPRSHLIASFRLSLFLAALASSAAFAVAGCLTLVGNAGDAWIVLALAFALPGALIREFARRVSFAHERSIEAVLIDGPTVCAGLIGIAGLGWMGHLTATTALLVLAATNLAAGLCWVLAKRLRLNVEKGLTHRVALASWAMGRWLIIYQITMQAQGYTMHWLALIFLGAQATGVYAACLSIIAFANPLLYGLFNVMVPSSARIYRQEGNHGVIQRAMRDSAVLAGLMAVFCLAIALFGQQALGALYPKIGDAHHLLIVLSVASLIATLGAPAAIALTSANRAGHLACVTGISAFANLAVVLVLLPIGGLLGAAYGMVISEIIGAAGRWLALYRVAASPPINVANSLAETSTHAG